MTVASPAPVLGWAGMAHRHVTHAFSIAGPETDRDGDPLEADREVLSGILSVTYQQAGLWP